MDELELGRAIDLLDAMGPHDEGLPIPILVDDGSGRLSIGKSINLTPQEDGNCPACNTPISRSDKYCPNCENYCYTTVVSLRIEVYK